jgi:hypothetical protein
MMDKVCLWHALFLQINGENLALDIYFYMYIAGDFSLAVKKMNLPE